VETTLETRETLRVSRHHSDRAETGTGGAEMPLSTLRTGDYGTVLRMDGGEEFRGRMLALGIIPGKTVTVAKGEIHQPFLLRVDDSRVMVDWSTLYKIYVQPGHWGRRGGRKND
jgi:Fe2+ transport system protein FeoA